MKFISTTLLFITFLVTGPDLLHAQNADVGDSLALVDFFHSTGGPYWSVHTGWLKGPVSTWSGVVVDSNGRVITLGNGSANFQGTIPASFGNLTALQNFWASYGQLSGPLPASMGNMKSLKNLDLAGNQISGSIPPSLGNLSNLEMFELDDNQLTGSIPASFGGLTNLKILSITNNQLTDTLPASLGNLTNLKYMDLNGNQLTSSLPVTLSNLTNLLEVQLGNNQLSGAAPPSLQNLINIQTLNINNNYFNFDCLEPIAQNFGFAGYYPQRTTLPLDMKDGKLYVNAGGTVTNNTYTWYWGSNPVATITGDSTYTPTLAGVYWVSVTNSIANQITLSSYTYMVSSTELPVSLINFTGQLTHDGTLLNWQTASEINTATFNVQRSTDGQHFVTVGKVNAAGYSNVIQNYKYTDALANVNTTQSSLFYRLQEIDKTGLSNYSKIIRVNNIPTSPSITLIYPNPVHNILHIRPVGMDGKVTVTITGIDGKRLFANETKNILNGTDITLNISTLAAGIYVLHVNNNGKTVEQKFVKQ